MTVSLGTKRLVTRGWAGGGASGAARAPEGRRGFRLTELMVVCVVAAVLASVAVPAFTKAKESTHKTELQATLRAFQASEELFVDTNGGFAERWEDLDMNLSRGVRIVDYLAVGGTYWSVLLRHDDRLIRCVGSYETTPLCWSPVDEWS